MRFPPYENFAALVRLVRELVSTESLLLKAELSENKGRAISGAIFGACAALFWILAVALGAVAAAAWLTYAGFAPHVAITIVFGVFLLLAVVATAIATAKLRSMTLVPHKTVQQIKRDFALLENSVHGH